MPRVHFIRDCVLRTDPLAIFVAVSAFFFLGVPLLFVSLNWLHSTPFTNHALAFPISFLICFAVLGLDILLVGKFMHRRKRSWNRYRVARLERFLQHANARRRFPHRFIEFHHYSRVEKSRGLKKHLAKLPPGEVVMVDCPRNETDWRVRRSQSAFEPIPWEPGEERLLWLLTELPDPDDDPRMSEPATGVTAGRRLKAWLPRILHLFLMFIGLRTLIRALIAGQWTAAMLGCGIVLAVLALAAFNSLVVGRRYFLVPGGLVRLETGLLFRTPRLELYTPRNATLMLYADGGGFVASQGRVQFIDGDDVMMLCLMLAWINEARAPTIQELRTLLTPEGAIASQPVGDV